MPEWSHIFFCTWLHIRASYLPCSMLVFYYEFHSLIFTLNLGRLTYVTLRAALRKSVAERTHSYRSRGAESPFSRSDGKGSHRTPAWKLIILRFEKIDLVQQNDFPHIILRYQTYTCVLYSHENTIVTAKIEKFRGCTRSSGTVTAVTVVSASPVLIWPPGKISFADDSYWLYYFQYMFVHISSIGLSIQLCSFSFLYNLGKRPVIAISYKNMF